MIATMDYSSRGGWWQPTRQCDSTGCGTGMVCSRQLCGRTVHIVCYQDEVAKVTGTVEVKPKPPSKSYLAWRAFVEFIWSLNIMWQDSSAFDDQRHPERHFHRQRYIRAAQRRRGPRPIRGLGSRRG